MLARKCAPNPIATAKTSECVAPRCPPLAQDTALLSPQVTGPNVCAIVALGWSRSGSIAAPAQMIAPAMSSVGLRAVAMIPVSMNREDSFSSGSAANGAPGPARRWPR